MKRLLALLALTLGLLAGLPAGPATAAGELGLSPDGVTWAAALPGPIFDPASRWVPGDSEIGSFYVRNQSPDDGVLGLTLQGTQVTDLIDTGDLTVSTRLDEGDWTSVTTAGPHTLLTDEDVPSGAVRKVDVRVEFDAESGNATEDKVFDLRFTVDLHQGPVVSEPSTGPGQGDGDGDGGGAVSGPGGDLPNTGSDIRPWMLLVGGLSIALGVVLARRSTKASEKTERAHHG